MVHIGCHINGRNLATNEKEVTNLKQSDGGQAQFLHRMVFHSNHLLDVGTCRKEMDLCPIRVFFFLKKSFPFLTNLSQSQICRV